MNEQLELAVQIARIDENVTDMHHRLFGNGQPGALKDFEDRLSSLENKDSYTKGFKAAVWGAITLLTSGTLIELFRGKL